MDAPGNRWHNPCMSKASTIPVYVLFGESGPFPDVVHCETIGMRAPAHGWLIAPHRHDRIVQVLVLTQGGAAALVDGRQQALVPGDALVLPAGVVHGFDFRPGTDGLVISVPLPVLAAMGPAPGALAARLVRPFAIRTTARMTGLAELIADRPPEEAGPLRDARMVGLAQALLADLAAAAPAASGPEGRAGAHLAAFRVQIARRLADRWGPADHARALGITAGQLGRICRAALGRSPRAGNEGAPMVQACRMLAFTQMPVAEVGWRLGFGDPSHFARRFRRTQGETPSAYRARFVQDRGGAVQPSGYVSST